MNHYSNTGRLILSAFLFIVSLNSYAVLLTFNPSDQGYITESRNLTLSDINRTTSLLVGRLDGTLALDDDVVESVGVYKFDLRTLQPDWIINSAYVYLSVDTTTAHIFNTSLDQAFVGALWGGDPYNPPEVVQSDFGQNGGFSSASNFYPSTAETRFFDIKSAVDGLSPDKPDYNGFLRIVVAPDTASNFSFGAAMGGMYVTNASIQIDYSVPSDNANPVPVPATLWLVMAGFLGMIVVRGESSVKV